MLSPGDRFIVGRAQEYCEAMAYMGWNDYEGLKRRGAKVEDASSSSGSSSGGARVLPP